MELCIIILIATKTSFQNQWSTSREPSNSSYQVGKLVRYRRKRLSRWRHTNLILMSSSLIRNFKPNLTAPLNFGKEQWIIPKTPIERLPECHGTSSNSTLATCKRRKNLMKRKSLIKIISFPLRRSVEDSLMSIMRTIYILQVKILRGMSILLRQNLKMARW